jgi:pyruvate/2-oxoglutarate dehydrogenase complex dihydrolipoamide dehydrogenase (E3) component
VVKVFEPAIVRTGLQEEQPRNAGSDPRTDQSAFLDSTAHYPGAQEIVSRICGDKSTGGLLGAQLIGHWNSEISKRVDIFGTALFHKGAMERRAHPLRDRQRINEKGVARGINADEYQ